MAEAEQGSSGTAPSGPETGTTEIETGVLFQNKFPLLDYEKQIFIDVMENDALTIFAKGLSYSRVVSCILWAHADPTNLVLVINAGEGDEKHFSERLGLSALPALGSEREKTYLEGGVHFVSTRVLVVDLLKGRVPTAHVTGVVVLRAHSVLESCQEAFALRLYRQANKTGFIKGFSNSPISFTFGYGHVEKVMRSLFLTELFLWPRFHGSVIKCLKAREACVVELHVPLSDNTAHIQRCLLDLVNYTIKQLKAKEKNLTMQEVTTENCISHKFHKALQAQLDSVWHQLGTGTKQHVQDLKVLRSMIVNLIHDDPISFYALVSKYRTPEYAHVNSGWILLDSAEQLFRLAKGRVYNSKKEFDPEPCPKWQCLSDLLTKEIPDEVKKKNTGELINTKILILCQDNRTCSQLNGFLTMGPSKYLFYTAFRRDVPVNAIASKYKEVGQKVQSDLGKKDTKKKTKKPEDKKKEDPLEESLEDEEDLLAEECNKSNYVLTLTQVAQDAGGEAGLNESTFEPFSQMENMDLTVAASEKPLICIQTFKDYGNHYSLERTLETLRPQYIIMYHSDVAAIRQVEVHECRKTAREAAATVYLILHNQTVEEQAYLTSLKREKQAFEHLIQTKSVMVVPSYQDGKSEELFNVHEEEEEAVDTRKAGGQKSESKEKPLVIVDMREFRSDLPALLHKRGINIEPITITVGDYILTPDICVERKSISDLIGSLNSGRLYTQCTQMCRHYARPVLLIEFDQNKPFNLQGNLTMAEASGTEVQQKLQLLTIHFPRLKLVWSPSPYATAQLFYELKQGRKNPNARDTAALQGDGDGAEEASYERYNTLVHDFARKLPGVTSKNIGRLMNRGSSLDHLVTLTQEKLAGMLESGGDATALHTVLHMRSRPADAARDDKPFKHKYTSKIFRKGDAKKPRGKPDS